MRLDLGLTWDPNSTDVWFTPPHIFDALGIDFDLDPAAPPGGVPWIPAKDHYSEIDDGLIQPWHGRVWLNPPYSNPRPWLERLRNHGDGVAMLPSDTSTAWWHESVATGDAHCFLRGRIRFVRADRGAETSAAFPSVLVAWGNVSAKAVRECGLGWVPC